MDKVVQYPIRFGVYDKLPPLLANSLGAYETTLMRLVTGYSEFVNGGKKISASLIDRIQDRNGKTIWRHDSRKCDGCNDATGTASRSRCWPTRASRSSIRAPPIRSSRCWRAWCSAAPAAYRSARSRQAAGRQDRHLATSAKDTWFIGFSPDLAAGVFVGFDNPRTLGRNEQGATVAAPIFRDFMKGALADAPPTPFRVAPGIEEVPIDWITSGRPVPPARPAPSWKPSRPAPRRAKPAPTAPASTGEPQPAPARASQPPRPRMLRRCARAAIVRARVVLGTGTDFTAPISPISAAMRPEIERAVDEIQQAIALLRRHL